MDEEVKKRLAVEIFAQTGIAVDPQDPVFVLAMMCKELIKEDTQRYFDMQQAVLNAIRSIPGELTTSVQIIADAIEKAENASEQLAKETVEKAKAEAGGAIAQSLGSYLDAAHKSLTELDRRAKAVGDSIRDKKSFRLNLILAGALLICASAFAAALWSQQAALSKVEKENSFYLRELQRLESRRNG